MEMLRLSSSERRCPPARAVGAQRAAVRLEHAVEELALDADVVVEVLDVPRVGTAHMTWAESCGA